MRIDDSWESHAQSWINWVRAERISGFEKSIWPALEDVLPGHVTGTVLDLGCGEGRSARELSRHGYRVVGIERSPVLALAAQHHQTPTAAVVCSATNIPLADKSVEVVVSCMSLQDIGDLRSTLAEVGRVLSDGGSLCLAIRHPFLTAVDDFQVQAEHYEVSRPYLEERSYQERMSSGGLEINFTSAHRPLVSYVTAITAAGLAVTKLNELGPGKVPRLLVLRAEKL